MADTIVVLREGVVEQIGSPIELYSRPLNRFVACFLGAPQMNILAATADGASEAGLRLAVDQGRARMEANVVSTGAGAGERFAVGLRPEHLTPSAEGLRACVEASEILGAETIIYAVLQSGERIAASLRGLHRVRPGEPIGFAIDRGDLHVFDADGTALKHVGEAPLGGLPLLDQDEREAPGLSAL